ncbi:MAG: hypothetical protein L6R28_11320 [Planctomycetes bacterium]|nr:hypothetical protein [Planctomycetota bacterium]
MATDDEAPAGLRKLGPLDCGLRAAALLLGVLVFLSAVFAVEIVLMAPPSAAGNALWFKEVWEVLAQGAVVVVPPVLAGVALVAWDLYRLATHLRTPVHTNMWALGAAMVVLAVLNAYVTFLIVPFIPFLLQRLRRRKLFSANPSADWMLPSAYVLLFGVAGTLLGDGPPRSLLEAVPVAMIVCYFGVLIQDCLMVDRMARWSTQGRLKVLQGKTFQFSLGSLLAVVMGLAAYVTGLVLIFR